MVIGQLYSDSDLEGSDLAVAGSIMMKVSKLAQDGLLVFTGLSLVFPN